MKTLLATTAVLAFAATPAYAQLDGSAEGSVSVDAAVDTGPINDGTDGTMAPTGTPGTAGKLGVGMYRTLRGDGIGNPVSVVYDVGKFHLGGFLGFADGEGDDDFAFEIGGQFWYHVAQSAIGDFSVGGNVKVNTEDQGPDDSDTELYIEPGFQIRAFIVPNVALSFTGALSIGAVDAGGVELGAQVHALGGVHYYF